MSSGISFTKIWEDDDLLEIRIEMGDGQFRFQNEVYAGHAQLSGFVAALDELRLHIHGGQYEMQFGEFGPQFGGGACQLIFHFDLQGRLFITVHLQSEFFERAGLQVANEGKFHLFSHPAQLDNFVRGLAAIRDRHSDNAVLDIG